VRLSAKVEIPKEFSGASVGRKRVAVRLERVYAGRDIRAKQNFFLADRHFAGQGRRIPGHELPGLLELQRIDGIFL